MEERKKDMKRLVGGDYQLDLSHIEIEESADGVTYTSITDKSVLDQLTDLKSFIGKSGMMKPVWVKLLNGETDEIVVTRGSLSTSDGVTFLIKVLLVGFILTLSVEFTQAETEDHTPLDDWYIDTNDAKYILISDAQAIGSIEELPIFENIVDKDGHKRFIEEDITTSEIAGITFTYAKWSLSGTHLMFVLAGTIADETVLADNTNVAAIELPSWMADKIYNVSGEYIETKEVPSYKVTQEWISTDMLKLTIGKASNGKILIRNIIGAQTFTYDGAFRMQFDLLIDNEETPAP